MELFGNPPHVAQPARILGQQAELEAMVGEHDQGRPGVERCEKVADDPVGVLVDRLHGVAVPALLLGELAREALGAEEMPEKVRGRVGALEVDQHQIRAFAVPEFEPEVAVGAQGREDPPEVLQVVLEIERAGEVGSGDIDVRREVRQPDLIGAGHLRAQPRLQPGRPGGAGLAGFLEALGEEEMPRQPVAGHEAVHFLRRMGRPPAEQADPSSGVGEQVPKRLGPPHVAGHRLVAPGRPIASDEVPDAVLIGALAGGDGRPEDGRKGRLEGLEATVGPFTPQTCEVRQLAFREQEIDRFRVEAVEAENEEARRPARSASERPGQQEKP